MVLVSLSKDESPKCKHLTIQVWQLITEFLRSPALTAYTIETGGKPHHASKQTGEKAKVLGRIRERGYTTAGRRDITRSRTRSTVIRNLTEKASLLT